MSGVKELEKILPDNANQLMADVRDYDDHASFVILFHMFKKPVAKYIHSKINSSSDTENLSQEIFTRLWANRRNFRPDGQFDGYLFGIAAKVVNSFKRQQIKEQNVISLEQVKNMQIIDIQRKLSDYSHPQERLIVQELLKQAVSAVANLPSKYRDVFKLIVEKNCTVKKASRLLQCSETTVRRRYKLAVRKLRRQLSAKERI